MPKRVSLFLCTFVVVYLCLSLSVCLLLSLLVSFDGSFSVCVCICLSVSLSLSHSYYLCFIACESVCMFLLGCLYDLWALSKGVFFTSLCLLFVCFVCFYLNDYVCNYFSVYLFHNIFFMYTVASLQQFSSLCVYLLKTSSCLSISSFSVHVYIPLHK